MLHFVALWNPQYFNPDSWVIFYCDDSMFHRRRFGSQLEMDLAQLCHLNIGQQGLVLARHRKVPPARLDCQRDRSQRELPIILAHRVLLEHIINWHAPSLVSIFGFWLRSATSRDARRGARFSRWSCATLARSPSANSDQVTFYYRIILLVWPKSSTYEDFNLAFIFLIYIANHLLLEVPEKWSGWSVQVVRVGRVVLVV